MLNTLVLVTLSSVAAASAASVAALPELNVIMKHTFAQAYSCKGNYEISTLSLGYVVMDSLVYPPFYTSLVNSGTAHGPFAFCSACTTPNHIDSSAAV
jgi:hypothetical protein